MNNNLGFAHRAWLIALFLFIAVVTCYPAFTRYSLYSDSGPSDEKNYIQIYQGRSLTSIERPFRYRVMVPWLARLMPSPPKWLRIYYNINDDKVIQYKFGLVNILGLTLAAYWLFAYLVKMGFAPWQGVLGVMLYFTSFEVAVNSGMATVDTWAYAFLILCFYLLQSKNHPLLGLAVLLGMFFKETTIFCIFGVFAYSKSRKELMKRSLWLIPGTVAYLIFRLKFITIQDAPLYSLGMVLKNMKGLFDFNHFLYLTIQFALTFGPLWVLAYLGWKQRRLLPNFPAARLLLFASSIMLIPLILPMSPSRIWFLTFPFIVPLALLGLLQQLPVRKNAPEKDTPTEPAEN